MSRRVTIQIVSAVVVLVFAVGIWSTGGSVEMGWLRFYSAAVLVAVAVLGLWDRWIWRTRLAQRFGPVPRDLRGTWKGALMSAWIDPATGRVIDPKPAYLVVRQTATSVSATLLTDESKSTSSLAAVSTAGHQVTLDYLYLNRPDSRVEHRSRMHHGSTVLDVTGSPATRLRGRYWTDRDSKGELDLAIRARKLADDYDEAVKLFV